MSLPSKINEPFVAETELGIIRMRNNLHALLDGMILMLLIAGCSSPPADTTTIKS
jgi:hypothetical protein